jgi:hypothetical protein
MFYLSFLLLVCVMLLMLHYMFGRSFLLPARALTGLFRMLVVMTGTYSNEEEEEEDLRKDFEEEAEAEAEAEADDDEDEDEDEDEATA